jgi:catechol 2,3-dioxygenase-like lactoylglutathione lyase family enzyme
LTDLLLQVKLWLHIERKSNMPQVRLHHVAIPMPYDALETARAFYTDVLGLQEKASPSTLSHRKLIWYEVGGDKELHLFPTNDRARLEELHHLCLVVDDDAALAEFRAGIEQAGIAVQEAPRIPLRNRFYVRDPFNNRIEISTIEGDYREAE